MYVYLSISFRLQIGPAVLPQFRSPLKETRRKPSITIMIPGQTQPAASGCGRVYRLAAVFHYRFKQRVPITAVFKPLSVSRLKVILSTLELWILSGFSQVSLVEVLLYVHRNRRFIRDGSPGRPPRLSHSSWALKFPFTFCCPLYAYIHGAPSTF